MNYKFWDYSVSNFMNKCTEDNMLNFFESSSSEKIEIYIEWLNVNKNEFLLHFNSRIICDLVKFENYSLVDNLIEKKIINFNQKSADLLFFRMSILFNKKNFDYTCEKVNKIDSLKIFPIYIEFWKNFLSFQFQNNDDVNNKIENIDYVFQKIPFYISDKYDIKNKSLVDSRKEFFEKIFSTLDDNYKSIFLKELTILCAKKYPQFKTIFKEEFEKYPEALNIFEKTLFYENMKKNFPVKKNEKKKKI